MKRISILGSTGSIGVSTLQVVQAMPDRFEVVALGAGGNVELLAEQARRFRPQTVAVKDRETARRLEACADLPCRVVHSMEGLIEVASHPDVEVVVSGLVGALGLRPTHAALKLGRDVALANKEVLVVAGECMTRLAGETGARILPVDSEHNALHQCLKGERLEEVRRVWLTASGGPFRELTAADLERVTPDQALRHPTWKMGPKITVDSATMMNKGLEVIEARWLFELDPRAVRVVIHPQSVVHSMVEFVDGSFKAQLGVTDMRHPIQYALCWPDRLAGDLPPFDPVAAGPLEFERPDPGRFPCLDLAYRALEAGGASPAVLNAANEVAVGAFLKGKTGFMQIPRVVESTLSRHAGEPAGGLDELLAVDASARRTAHELLGQGVGS